MYKFYPAKPGRPRRFRHSWAKLLGTYCGKGPKDRYRKFKYPNLLVALMACEEMRRRGYRKPGEPNINPYQVYHCDCCGGIHIGHLTKEESVLLYEGDEPINIRQLQGLDQSCKITP